MLKASRSRSVHQVESVLGALETELLNGQPEVNKIAALRWEKRQQNFGKDMMMKVGEVPVPKFLLWICSRFNSFLLLSRVRGLFPGREPFWAGYGNKAWDILAYKVRKPFSRICIFPGHWIIAMIYQMQRMSFNFAGNWDQPWQDLQYIVG